MESLPEPQAEWKSCATRAVWGACLGIWLTSTLLAVTVAVTDRPNTAFHPDIIRIPVMVSSADVPWQEALEKRMFLLECLMCPLLAWGAIYLGRRLDSWSCLTSVLLSVSFTMASFGGAFAGQPSVLPLLLAALVLSVPMFKWQWLLDRAGPLSTKVHGLVVAQVARTRSQLPLLRRYVLPALLLQIVLFTFLFPLRPGRFGPTLWPNLHVVYCTVPAAYYLDSSKVPGLDFESQYGVGHGYAFSFFLQDSFPETMCALVWFIFLTTSFFFLTGLWVLTHFYRSPLPALAAMLVLIVSCMEADSYGYPSSWPIRFPFLFLFVACAAQERLLGRTWLPVILAGAMVGLSLFWQTDVGLAFGVAGLVFYAALWFRERKGLARLPLFVLSSFVSFTLIALLAFGPRVLSMLFFQRLLEPPLLYVNSFGFWLMNWQPGWHYLYNIVAPAITLGSIGWALQRLRTADAQARLEARYLFLFAVAGMLLLFKWVNRSLENLWFMNGMAVLVVLVWWVRVAALAVGAYWETRVGPQPAWSRGFRVRTLAGLGAAVLCLLGVLVASFFHSPNGQVPGRSSSPLVRIKKFFDETPTLAKRLACALRHRSHEHLYKPAQGYPVDPEDINLIRRHTKEGEPITVLALHDWIYIGEAHRPPHLPWVPVYFTHSRMQLSRVEKSFKEAQIVFVQKDSFDYLKQFSPELYERTVPYLLDQFEVADTGKNLNAYVRRASAIAPEHHLPTATVVPSPGH